MPRFLRTTGKPTAIWKEMIGLPEDKIFFFWREGQFLANGSEAAPVAPVQKSITTQGQKKLPLQRI